MHDTIVKMKDGRSFKGALHYFRPRWGWMSLMAGPDDAINRGLPLAFCLMESATTLNERLSVHVIGDCDELARARESGWSPSTDPMVVRNGVAIGTHAVAIRAFLETQLYCDDCDWVSALDGTRLVEEIWHSDGHARRSLLVRHKDKVGKPLEQGEICTVAQAGTGTIWEMIFSQMETDEVGWFWARHEKPGVAP